MTFGEKVRSLRKEKKMSQQELASMVGVSYRTIRSWEVEGRFPKQNVLYQKLADALQCDVSYNNRRRDYCTPNLLPYSYKDISALLFFTFEVIYLRNTYIYTETKKLIKKYGTRDPFEIMDQMNIVVGETSRYKTLKGYCFMSCKTIYVMISSFLSEEKMIVAAHELGHIMLQN